MAETRMQKAERMSDLIVDLEKRIGCCGDDDLRRAGFPQTEIDDLRALACAMATLTRAGVTFFIPAGEA